MAEITTTQKLYEADYLGLVLHRLTLQVLELHADLAPLRLLGIQPRGTVLAQRMQSLIEQETGHCVPMGILDTTFHRDDYRRRESPLLPSAMDVPFGLEGQNVLLVDDVLYTGRTIRAAMDALLSFGRPARVELLVLVDRIRRREVPVEPTYWGMRVDSVASDRVVVNWREMHDEDAVILVSQ